MRLSYICNFKTPYPAEIGVPITNGSTAYYRFDHATEKKEEDQLPQRSKR